MEKASKISLNEMLEVFKPKHEFKYFNLVSEYSCGCTSTIDYGGNMKVNCSTGKKISPFQSTNIGCKENHNKIDFENAEKVKDIVEMSMQIMQENTYHVPPDMTDKKNKLYNWVKEKLKWRP